MKKIDFLKTIGIIFLLFIIKQSYCLAQKSALKCPELQRTYLNNQVSEKNRHNNKPYAYSKGQTGWKSKPRNHYSSVQKTKSTDLNTYINSKQNLTEFERVTGLSKIQYKNNLTAALNSSSLFAISKSSTISHNTDFERISISKISGKNFYCSNNPVNNATLQEIAPKKVEPLGLAGMIVGLAGFLIAGIPCGIIAIIFGSISLGRFKKNPDKYKGKGFAITALTVGLVVLILTIALIV